MSVIAIKGATPPGEMNEDLVDLLEELLTDAKSGHLRGLAYASTNVDGTNGTGWIGSDGARDPLATSIMILNHRYAEALQE